MARKTAVQNEANVQEALEEWETVTEVRYEIAKDAYDFQDDKTKKVIDRIVNRLRVGANGYITVRVNPPHGATVPVKINQEYLDYNLLYVATEILKDMAMFDVKVANYKFPPSLCVGCGAEIVKETPKKRKRRSA